MKFDTSIIKDSGVIDTNRYKICLDMPDYLFSRPISYKNICIVLDVYDIEQFELLFSYVYYLFYKRCNLCVIHPGLYTGWMECNKENMDSIEMLNFNPDPSIDINECIQATVSEKECHLILVSDKIYDIPNCKIHCIANCNPKRNYDLCVLSGGMFVWCDIWEPEYILTSFVKILSNIYGTIYEDMIIRFDKPTYVFGSYLKENTPYYIGDVGNRVEIHVETDCDDVKFEVMGENIVEDVFVGYKATLKKQIEAMIQPFDIYSEDTGESYNS